MTEHVLVVDNDPLQCRTAELSIQKLLGYKVTCLRSGAEALEFLKSDKGQEIDVVLLDLVMPGVSGLEVLRAIKPHRPELPIIIHSAHGDLKTAVEAMAEGAVDFVEKKEGEERLKVALQNAARLKELQSEISRLQRSVIGETRFSDIIGDSYLMKETRRLSQQAAESNIPVLIKGESGVGKELFARAIHGASARAGKPFVPVNCGAIPENLVESVLFGHEKGSFTGAHERSIGKFREADGGTLFLDEIGELKHDLQVKLLRALQEGEVEPVGAPRPLNVNVRIISATNRSLKDDIHDGVFREDLYYRLNVFPITVPPLRSHSEDVPRLLDFFTRRIAAREGKHTQGVSEDAKQLLKSYSWPGNIRQLENAVYRAVVLSEAPVLNAEAFNHVLSPLENDAPAPLSRRKRLNDTEALAGPGKALPLVTPEGHIRPIAELEEAIIRTALEHHGWRISEVARRLKIGRSTLYRKMAEYGIEDPESGKAASE